MSSRYSLSDCSEEESVGHSKCWGHRVPKLDSREPPSTPKFTSGVSAEEVVVAEACWGKHARSESAETPYREKLRYTLVSSRVPDLNSHPTPTSPGPTQRASKLLRSAPQHFTSTPGHPECPKAPAATASRLNGRNDAQHLSAYLPSHPRHTDM
jgi:hypothetical protein